MKFEYDIFISYPPATGTDSQPSTEWALKFSDLLSVLMERLYNRKPSIMLHDDLRVRQSMLGESSKTLLGQSAVAVIILSPEYNKTASYLRELEEIHQAFGPQGDQASGRLFTIFSQPLAGEEQPGFLKEGIHYNFFEINRYNKKAITYDLNAKNGPDNRFWSKLVDLTYDISGVLSALTGFTHDTIPSSDTPCVFLAETSFDQVENRDMLKRELQHLGFRVLPQSHIPDDAEHAREVIENSLRQSVVAVHMLGAWYGDPVKNSKLSFTDFQIKTVKEFISGKENKVTRSQLIWIPNDIKPTDQRQALYLKRLKRDEAQYQTEIIETPFEVFKTILNLRLNEIIHPTVIPPAQKNKLYAIFEPESSREIEKYLKQIRDKGFEIIEPDLECEANPLTRHINNLLIADAVLIYKGDCPMDWLNSKLRDLVKAPGYGKSKPFRAVEIISSQKAADKSLLFLNNVPVNWDEELNADVINHFLEHLAKK
jgi:hypothetical protein